MCIQDISKHLAEFHVCSLEKAIDEMSQKLPDEKKETGHMGFQAYPTISIKTALLLCFIYWCSI